MANVKISGLPAATSVAGANEFEINEAGTSKKVTGSQIASYVDSTLTYLDPTDIGNTVQGYDVDTTKNDVANTFTANQIISVTDNSNAALRVTQLGTGNAVLIEDSANPDSSPVVVDASGNVGIGVTTTSVPLMVRRDQATDTLVDLWNATNNSAASITTRYVTNNVAGSGTSTATITKAKTGAFSISNNDASGFITLGTNGSERFRVGSVGQLGVAGANYGTDGQFLMSKGASAAPQWETLNTGGMTLLGTLTTTSGTTQTLSGLTLTEYKEIKAVIDNVSATADARLRIGGQQVSASSNSAGNSHWGHITVSLANSVFSSNLFSGGSTTGVIRATTNTNAAGKINLTTASTSIEFSLDTGSFDAGSILVYGVK